MSQDKNRIERVAVVGAGGRIGGHITRELLSEGKFKITALTRADSTSKIPEGIETRIIDYKDPDSLVAALLGQDALVITMATLAPPGQQNTLIEAAAEAEVPWVIPNDWAFDHSNDKNSMLGASFHATVGQIEKLGKSSWIAITCGFWYELSLATGPATFGFDFRKKAATFYDDGISPFNASTMPQTARAVARLLGLPIVSEDGADKSPSLSSYRNKSVHISSFTVTQKDIYDSILRVTGTSSSDWKIDYEPSEKRFQAAVKQSEVGDYVGFVKSQYARMLYPDGSGNYGKTCTLSNDILGLPREDLDEYTKLGATQAETNPLYLE